MKEDESPGMKDHEIRELTDKLAEALEPYVKIQWVRTLISVTIIEYFKEKE